jgi:hypothetical protein
MIDPEMVLVGKGELAALNTKIDLLVNALRFSGLHLDEMLSPPKDPILPSAVLEAQKEQDSLMKAIVTAATAAPIPVTFGSAGASSFSGQLFAAAPAAGSSKLSKDDALAAYYMGLSSAALLARNNPRLYTFLDIMRRNAIRDWDDIWAGILKEAPQLAK